MKRILLITALLLSASSLQQRDIVFDAPVDALSVSLPTKQHTIFVRMNGEWTPLSVEDEADPELFESNLVIFPEPITRVTMKGDLSQVALHPVSVSKEPASYAVAATRSVGKPRILKRHQWGADDSFLVQASPSSSSSTSSNVSKKSNGSAASKRVEDCNTARTRYPGDFTVDTTITHDNQGKRLRWARRYSPKVKVLTVHHTAQKITGDPRPPVERMRALYAFHANNRGWGDIGYHYIIDEEGTIYEGRSGGESVVGGHVYCANVGTIGVSLMGNFDEEQPTQPQIHALQWLLNDLADTYDISVKRNVFFQGKNIKPIVRHKDLISTECPGYYMSAAIAQVRRNVIAGNFDQNVTFPTIARTRTDRTQSRLSSRLEKAGEALSRRFYRAKRLVRTAGRQTNDARMHMIERERRSGATNIQKQRAARDARRRRIAEARKPSTTPTPSTAPDNSSSDDIRIRLSHTGNTAEISAEGTATVNGQSIRTVRLGKDGNNCVAIENGRTVSEGIVRIDPGNTVLRIASWNTSLNRFRGVIECRIVDGSLALINELPLEQYMAGLSEEPDTEPFQKQRAFAIAARSYAAYYVHSGSEKFPGKPYHGSDSAASFQRYSGVTFEEYNPDWVRAVSDTAGITLTKNGKLLKAAYFSSDDGRTRSPAENGWKNFPFAEVFASKPDPWCAGLELRGHGVGMSGCGAKAQAHEGKTAEHILEYYYPGTTLLPLQ